MSVACAHTDPAPSIRQLLGLGGTRVPTDGLEALLERVRGRELDLNPLLELVIETVCEALHADRGTLYLVDHASQQLVSRAARLPEIAEIRLDLGEGLAGWVARHRAAVLLPDARKDPRHAGQFDDSTGYKTESLMAVPVLAPNGELLAVLQVLNKRGGLFREADLGQAERMAEGVATLLATTSLGHQLRGDSQQRLSWRFNNIVGDSVGMQAVYSRVTRAARTAATVLIRGESGTGKELIARAIHFNSPRADKPFVKIDCAALPEHLVENELFGHVAGAFTGAQRQARGKVVEAEGGTLFLDEVGELPTTVQAKLLRLVQDRTYFQVGASRPSQADVRFVGATHRDLEQAVDSRQFRQDLYYRLRVVEVVLPSLRERGHSDLDRLVAHFLDRFCREHDRPGLTLTREAATVLHAHSWPGNVRELENCLESAVVLAPDRLITPDLLSLRPPSRPPATQDAFSSELVALREVELAYIKHVLGFCGGNRTRAARLLDIGRNTLIRRLKESS